MHGHSVHAVARAVRLVLHGQPAVRQYKRCRLVGHTATNSLSSITVTLIHTSTNDQRARPTGHDRQRTDGGDAERRKDQQHERPSSDEWSDPRYYQDSFVDNKHKTSLYNRIVLQFAAVVAAAEVLA